MPFDGFCLQHAYSDYIHNDPNSFVLAHPTSNKVKNGCTVADVKDLPCAYMGDEKDAGWLKKLVDTD